VALQVLDHKEHAGAPRPRLRGIGGCSALVPFRSASAQLHRRSPVREMVFFCLRKPVSPLQYYSCEPRVNTERLAERATLLHRLGSKLNRIV